MYRTGQLFLFLLLMGLNSCAVAQKQKPVSPPVLTHAEKDSLRKYEDSLRVLADSMVDGKEQPVRIRTLMKFIPAFVATLKLKGSFYYPFDSLRFMQKLTPPDQSFRLYTWLLKYDDASYRYYGVIQMNYEDSLKLFPLRDYRLQFEDSSLVNLTLGPNMWIGALYYKIIQTKHKKDVNYTLLGWDGNTKQSNKKVIEVLSFSETDEPVFGAPIFKFNEDSIQNRVIFEFSNDAFMMLNYIPEYELISFDNLVPPNPNAKGQYETYVPDGTYDYFIFKKGYWVWGEELFKNFTKPIKEAGDIEVEDPKEKKKK